MAEMNLEKKSMLDEKARLEKIKTTMSHCYEISRMSTGKSK